MTLNEKFRSEFGTDVFLEMMDIFITGDTPFMQCLSIGTTSPITKDVYLLVGDTYIHASYTLCMTSDDGVGNGWDLEILEYGKEITMPLGPAFDDHRRNMRINKIVD
jgi:hypothetical protein